MLSPLVWLQLSPETRKKIVTKFNLYKSYGMDVQGGRVVSDGYTVNDLSKITTEGLKEVTGLDTNDFYALFNAFVLQLEQGETVNTAISDTKKETIIEETLAVAPEEEHEQEVFPEIVEAAEKIEEKFNVEEETKGSLFEVVVHKGETPAETLFPKNKNA